MSNDTFDIFSGVPDSPDTLWICSVEGLSSAKERMEQLASEKPGPYFVFSISTQQVMVTMEVVTSRVNRKGA